MREVVLGVLLVLLTASAAGAAPLRWVSEGTVQSVSDPDGVLAAAGIAVAVGDAFRVDVVGMPGAGWSGTARVGATLFHEHFVDAVIDDGNVGDELILGSDVPYALGASGLTVDFASVRLVQSSGQALASNAFPAEIVLRDWGLTSLALGGLSDAGGERFAILGSLTAVSLRQVPEPTSAALLALGLAALAQRRGSRISASCATDAMRSPSRV